jgi:hypothetical protein
VVVGGGVSPPPVCTAHRSNGLPRSGSSSVLGDICSRMATCGLLLGDACRAAHMYAAGVMAVLVLGGSRSRVGMAFSLSVHRRAVCSFALSAALCKSAGGITTCTSSPFFAAHTHPLYLHHHHPHPSSPIGRVHVPALASPHERSLPCGLQQKSNLLRPPPGPPPTAPCAALLCSIEPCVTSPRRHARACITIQITAVR